MIAENRSSGLKTTWKRAFPVGAIAAMVMAICIAFAGCSAQDKEAADIEKIDNGYGTIFVSGRTIEHVADTSTSTVVDWRKEPAAKAGKDLDLKEVDGIVYSHSEYTDGRDKGKALDLHLNLKTNAKAKGLQPVAIFVPGGGFITCEIDGKYENVHRYLVEKGYAIAVMEYHIIGQGTYEDAVRDVREAINWVKENGREYGIDPEKIFLIGNSGGGYVASLAACQDPSDIKCVVNFYGLSALADNKADYEEAAIKAHHTPESSDSQFAYGVYSGKALGADPEFDSKNDPVSYVDGDEPPFIHFHGDADLWVSPSQSLHLHEALAEKGETTQRYVLKGEGHGAAGFRTKKALDKAVSFMDKYK